MTNLILVAYDGTPASDRAFDQALTLAQQSASTLHVVAVAWSAEVETRRSIDRARVRCTSCLRGLHARAVAADVDLELEVAEGIVADQIVAAAERIGADTIVMGHRHRSLIDRMAEGSVAKRVIDRARCCVLVAP